MYNIKYKKETTPHAISFLILALPRDYIPVYYNMQIIHFCECFYHNEPKTFLKSNGFVSRLMGFSKCPYVHQIKDGLCMRKMSGAPQPSHCGCLSQPLALMVCWYLEVTLQLSNQSHRCWRHDKDWQLMDKCDHPMPEHGWKDSRQTYVYDHNIQEVIYTNLEKKIIILLSSSHLS